MTRHYLSRPLPQPTWLAEQLADVLSETGSFSSVQQSLDFIQVVALEEIVSVIRLSLRLEFTFRVEVASSDMSLLFETPGTLFDNARMISDFGSDGAPTLGRQDRVAGTTEVGVEKRICDVGESSRTEILLKTKVVLEKDVMVGS